jgi:hypothetical protein
MPSDDDVPVLAADLVDKIERHVQADPRVISCYVEGSPPTRPGDLYADAMFYVGFDTKESFEAIFGNVAEWLAPVTRIVLTKRVNSGWTPNGIRNCLTDEGLRLDFAGHWMRHSRVRPFGRILKETSDAFKSEPTPVRYQQPCADAVLQSIEQFWCAFALIGRAIRDDAVTFGYLAYLERYRDAYNVLAHRGPLLISGAWFQNILVSPEDDRLLASTVRVETLTPEVLAREYLKLGDLVATHGPAICQTVGAEYPLAAQEAVMRRVRDELRMHGIPC